MITWVVIALLVSVGLLILVLCTCFQTQNEEITKVQKQLKLADQQEKYKAMIRKKSKIAKRKHTELYRLLRDSESIERGLSAKRTWPDTTNIDVVTHVAYGSSWAKSRYISTCASLWAVKELLKLKNRSYFANEKSRIVKINVSKLPSDVILIDLTTEEDQELHIKSCHDFDDIFRFQRFADNFHEVLIRGYIPSDCLSYVDV